MMHDNDDRRTNHHQHHHHAAGSIVVTSIKSLITTPRTDDLDDDTSSSNSRNSRSSNNNEHTNVTGGCMSNCDEIVRCNNDKKAKNHFCNHIRKDNVDYTTKFAVILSFMTLLLLILLSIFYNSNKMIQSTVPSHRSLSQQQSNVAYDTTNTDDTDTTTNTNYSKYSCNYIYEKTPITGSIEQCNFAKTCNQNEGVWAPFLFCFRNQSSSDDTTNTAAASRRLVFDAILLSPIMIVWLIILFRLLGSTAEDYFSPALEMLATKLHLPPRFAGVTLLALGNGAADVSATIASIVNDPIDGYKMSLGALTGAAMMISCVISACVILTAHGVPCRGALVRDVMALIITVITVYLQLASKSIGPESITLFLSLYAIFVVLVLVADIYHRAVVLPRQSQIASNIEIQRQMYVGEGISAIATTANGSTTTGIPPHVPVLPNHNNIHGTTVAANDNNNNTTPILGTILSALSNYDATPDMNDDMGAGTGGGWGVDSDQFTGTSNNRPIQLHGQNGILSSTSMSSSGNGNHMHKKHFHIDPASQSPVSIEQDPDNSYTILHESTDMIDNICIQPGTTGNYTISIPIDTWYEAMDEAVYEIRQHFHVLIYDNIIRNEDLYTIHKALLLCELPFTIARQVTVPIPCEGYYCRGLVGLSLVLSPIWFVFYLWYGHETNLLGTSVTKWMIFVLLELCVVMFALCIVRYAPKGGGINGENGSGEMSLIIATPIALYGFVIAATWIDTIADALVSLLNFIGILLHIPGPVIGLTILAWGNSMGDLSANMTMARKGLANMAMTACFAGPVFNILVGLGLGFSSLAAQTGNITTEVELSPSAITGFIFIAVNGIALVSVGLGIGKGRIPKHFGYLALVVYSVYLIVSISLQYSKSG